MGRVDQQHLLCDVKRSPGSLYEQDSPQAELYKRDGAIGSAGGGVGMDSVSFQPSGLHLESAPLLPLQAGRLGPCPRGPCSQLCISSTPAGAQVSTP